MKVSWKILGIILLSLSICSANKTTGDRIQEHGYPFEEHTVETGDGYVLRMFRILPKQPTNKIRPVVFLQHGLLSSSDCWILNGPRQALGYLLSDAGYDVWLGNNRGNVYSKRHVSFSLKSHQFWNFDWHEIALYDLPAMLDYTLLKTNQTSLHYMAHSQGTTAFLVLTSTIPIFNKKIKSAHLIAPVAYMAHLESPLVKLIAPFTGRSNALVELIGSAEFFPNSDLLAKLKGDTCKENILTHKICSNFLFLFCGWNKGNLNATLLEEIFKTHPAGASVNQIIHYTQEYRSGKFRQFDYGIIRNQLTYRQPTPPSYDLSKVQSPMYLYYADNDLLSSVLDVQTLLRELSNVKLAYQIPHNKWNHLDFLWGINVKELVFDKVLENVNSFEKD